VSLTNSIRRAIQDFRSAPGEPFHTAWDRFYDLLNKCPHHQFDNTKLVSYFFQGLHQEDQKMIQAMNKGRFMYLGQTEAFNFLMDLARDMQTWDHSGSSSDSNQVQPTHFETKSEPAFLNLLQGLTRKVTDIQTQLNTRPTPVMGVTQQHNLSSAPQPLSPSNMPHCDYCMSITHLAATCPEFHTQKCTQPLVQNEAQAYAFQAHGPQYQNQHIWGQQTQPFQPVYQPTPVQQQGYFQHTPVQPQQYFQQPYQAPVVPNPSVQPQGYYQPTSNQNPHGYYNQPQVQNQPIFQQQLVPNPPVQQHVQPQAQTQSPYQPPHVRNQNGYQGRNFQNQGRNNDQTRNNTNSSSRELVPVNNPTPPIQSQNLNQALVPVNPDPVENLTKHVGTIMDMLQRSEQRREIDAQTITQLSQRMSQIEMERPRGTFPSQSVANPRGAYEVGSTSETQNEEIFSVTTLRSGKQFENPIPLALDKFNPSNPPMQVRE